MAARALRALAVAAAPAAARARGARGAGRLSARAGGDSRRCKGPSETALALATRRACAVSAAGAASAAAGASASALAPGTLVLGIESSCDDTGAAVVSGDGVVLGEAIASQDAIHERWGGVVPKLAEEAHAAAIDAVVDEVLGSAGIDAAQLSAVAVTVGPGLSLCLRVGVTKAHRIAREHGLKVVDVHHMEAHALVARLTERQKAREATAEGAAAADAAVASAAAEGVAFPFVCLLVSGGHSMFLLAHGIGDYTILGTSLDDAVGEAFDKTARLLGLPVGGGGGPALEKLAAKGDPTAVPFRVPMRQKPTCDLSFAGLKTAVRYAADDMLGGGTERNGHSGGERIEWEPSAANEQVRADIAASFQRVAVQHLCDRAKRALQWARQREPHVGALVVAGGVAANATLREGLVAVCDKASAGLEEPVRLVCPPPRYCTDNGVMVAWAGVEKLQRGEGRILPPLEGGTAAEGEGDWVELRPRWPLGVPHEAATSVKSQKNEWESHMKLSSKDKPEAETQAGAAVASK